MHAIAQDDYNLEFDTIINYLFELQYVLQNIIPAQHHEDYIW